MDRLSNHLVAPNYEIRDNWISALEYLREHRIHKDAGDESFKSWLRIRWNELNPDKADELDVDGITSLLRKLNVKLSKSEVKSGLKVCLVIFAVLWLTCR
jgi:hypothetical protein